MTPPPGSPERVAERLRTLHALYEESSAEERCVIDMVLLGACWLHAADEESAWRIERRMTEAVRTHARAMAA